LRNAHGIQAVFLIKQNYCFTEIPFIYRPTLLSFFALIKQSGAIGSVIARNGNAEPPFADNVVITENGSQFMKAALPLPEIIPT